MKKNIPSLHPQHIMQTAKEVIFEQKLLFISIRRSAWWLFQHELTRTDPQTGHLYTPYKALDNVLKWMAEQAEMLERVKREPTQLQRRLLQLLADGKTQKEIAYELGIDARNIRKNFSRMRSRMGAETVFQLVAISVKKGWITIRRNEQPFWKYTGKLK